MEKSQRLAILALLLGVVGIGFAPVFAKLAVNLERLPDGSMGLNPAAAAFWRMALAAPLFWLSFIKRHGVGALSVSTRRAGASKAWLLLPGVLFGTDLSMWHWSFEYTPVANATLEANLSVIIIALASWLWLGERLSWLYPLGTAIALGGMIRLVGFSLEADSNQWIGDLLGVATAFAYGAYILATKKLVSLFPVGLVMVGSTTTAALCLLPVAFLNPGSWYPATAGGWGAVVGLALTSQIVGQGLIAYALSRLSASLSSVTLLLQPVVAGIFGWIILDQNLTPDQIVSCLVILAGIYLAKKGSLGSRDEKVA